MSSAFLFGQAGLADEWKPLGFPKQSRPKTEWLIRTSDHRVVSEYRQHEKMAYTVEEASELLSLSRAHLYRLIDLGRIRTISVGRSRRITSRQLDDFIRSLEQESGPTVTHDLNRGRIKP